MEEVFALIDKIEVEQVRFQKEFTERLAAQEQHAEQQIKAALKQLNSTSQQIG